MATEADYTAAEETLLDNIERGAKRVKYEDGREIEYITDAGVLETVTNLKSSTSSPFVKVGLSKRSL